MVSGEDRSDPDALAAAGQIELTVIKLAEVTNDKMMLSDVFDDCGLKFLSFCGLLPENWSM